MYRLDSASSIAFSSNGSSLNSSAKNRSRGTISAHPPNKWFPIQCNKCRQPIDATAFICSCHCLFCEDCTYSHFSTNPNCPRCGRKLGENDFTEVVVSDPNSKICNDPTKIYQTLLTKSPSNAHPNSVITWNDVCSALLRESDNIEQNMKLFINQFVHETGRKVQEGQNAIFQVQCYKRALAKCKADIIGLQRMHDETKERLRQKDRQLAEKDDQIKQLKRKLAMNNNYGNNWSSSNREHHGASSTNVPTRSSSTYSSSSMMNRSNSHPPSYRSEGGGFKAYARRKEERHLEEEREILNVKRNRHKLGIECANYSVRV